MKETDKISKFDRPQYVPLKTVLRPNSMDFMSFPTRISNTLFYKDGTNAVSEHKESDYGSTKRKRVVVVL